MKKQPESTLPHSFPGSLIGNTKRIALAAIVFAVAVLALAVQETKAQPNISIERVLERTDSSEASTLATNGEIYLFVSEGIKYMSKDGLNWWKSDNIIRVGSELLNYGGDTIIWDGKQFVLTARDVVAASTDGVNWTGTRIPVSDWSDGSHIIETIFYDNEKYILVAYAKDNTTATLPNEFYYSYDLKTWHTGTTRGMVFFSANSLRVTNLVWNGKVYLAGGQQSAYSLDGKHWEGNIALPDKEYTTRTMYNYAGDNDKTIWDGKKFWYAYGDEIESSATGKEWETAYTGSKKDVDLKTIAYNGQAYLATGAAKKGLAFYYSRDGKSWELVQKDMGKGDTFLQALPIKGGFLVAGRDVYYISDTEQNTPSSWAAEDLKRAASNRLVDTSLLRAYKSPITRSEFSRIAVNIYEALTGSKAELSASHKPFTDTYRPDVLKASALGIVNGVKQGSFAPDATITRQDMAVMLYNTLRAAGVSTPPSTAWAQSYADIEKVSSYAVEALRFFNQGGILNGKDLNQLAPLAQTSREEAYVLAQRIYEKYHSDNAVEAAPLKPGFDSIQVMLEQEGYDVFEQVERTIDVMEWLTSFSVRNQERREVFAYSKTRPKDVREEGLLHKVIIDGYQPGRDKSSMGLIQKVIEQHKGVELNGLAEELQQLALTGSGLPKNQGSHSFLEITEATVYFVSYWGGRDNLIIEVHY